MKVVFYIVLLPILVIPALCFELESADINMGRGCVAEGRTFELKLIQGRSSLAKNRLISVESDFVHVFNAGLADADNGSEYIRFGKPWKLSGQFWVTFTNKITGKVTQSRKLALWSCDIYRGYIDTLNKNISRARW